MTQKGLITLHMTPFFQKFLGGGPTNRRGDPPVTPLPGWLLGPPLLFLAQRSLSRSLGHRTWYHLKGHH